MFPGISDKTLKRVLVTVALPLSLLASPVQAQDGSQWGSGKNLYEKLCALCHDPAVGVGTVIIGRGLPEAYIRYIVRNGLNAMPAFPASYIDDESIAQVTEYLANAPAPEKQP